MNKITLRELTAAAVVAALYVALSLLSNVLGITFGPIQCRFSEALTLLPLLLSSSVWGLTVGCLLTNILSPYGLTDLVVGTLATFLAARLTGRCRSPYLGALPPVVCNAALVGALLAAQQTGLSPAFPAAFAYQALTVGLGEAVACYGLGVPLLRLLQKHLPALLPGGNGTFPKK